MVENKKGGGFVAYAHPLTIVIVWTQMMYFRAIHREHKQFLGQITKNFKSQKVLTPKNLVRLLYKRSEFLSFIHD
jgi:hypothetical protein